MTSDLTNAGFRQVIRAGDIFETSIGTPPQAESQNQYGSNTRVSTNKRRIIHVNYEDVFGEVLLPEVIKTRHIVRSSAERSYRRPSKTSVDYEEIIYGLTDESLKYFPTRERRRISKTVIRSLAAEFDAVADDDDLEIHDSAVIIQSKRFLQVPTFSSYYTGDYKTDKIGLDTLPGYDQTSSSPQSPLCLRRKPLLTSYPKKIIPQDQNNFHCCIS